MLVIVIFVKANSSLSVKNKQTLFKIKSKNKLLNENYINSYKITKNYF